MEVPHFLFLLIIAGTCRAYSLWCYSCSVKDQCFSFDLRDATRWTECDPGTTHCIMERTVSAVTGAVVENRMCGGQIYVAKNQPLADGCYAITRQEDSRINTTRCYCSTDYCNDGSVPYTHHAVVAFAVAASIVGHLVTA
ncbi:uncharacterized protein LOC108680768 [Hyalella azteca]|uniref:Uncharacterized protein LOC108680768 n=1 Tax=Hyalella azteca TaxID=294128 RepID=A0A8B7PG83_HYAAZ|nr:uncharacterized protein LOC108680768 [Hyalella azteca]